jgi:hypothetical protein
MNGTWPLRIQWSLFEDFKLLLEAKIYAILFSTSGSLAHAGESVELETSSKGSFRKTYRLLKSLK